MRADSLHRRVAADVVRMQVRVNDIEQRRIRYRAHELDNAIEILGKLVVDQNRALVTDEQRRVSRACVADRVNAVTHFDQCQLRRPEAALGNGHR